MSEPRERGMPTFAPNWYTDPSGRHRLRFYDGARWTDHVSDGSRTGIDPLPGTGPLAAQQPYQEGQSPQQPTQKPSRRERPGCMAVLVAGLSALLAGAIFVGGAYLILRGMGQADDPPTWLRVVSLTVVGVVFFAVLRGSGWPPRK